MINYLLAHNNKDFDQYFSEDVKERLLINGKIDEQNNFSFNLVPIYANQQGQLEFMNSERQVKFLERIADSSTVNSEIKEMIKSGFIQF